MLDGTRGWGLGLAIQLVDDELPAGSFGWDGGYGTSAYTDPARGLIGVLMTQRLWDSPQPPAVRNDFWSVVARVT